MYCSMGLTRVRNILPFYSRDLQKRMIRHTTVWIHKECRVVRDPEEVRIRNQEQKSHSKRGQQGKLRKSYTELGLRSCSLLLGDLLPTGP